MIQSKRGLAMAAGLALRAWRLRLNATPLLTPFSLLRHPSCQGGRTYVRGIFSGAGGRISPRVLQRPAGVGRVWRRTIAGFAGVQSLGGLCRKCAWAVLRHWKRCAAAGGLCGGGALLGGVALRRGHDDIVYPPLEVASTNSITKDHRYHVAGSSNYCEATFSQFTVWEQVQVATRFVYLALLFSPALFLYGCSRLFGSHTLEGAAWMYTMRALQTAGPAFVKLGQWASTRRDIFSEEFCDSLSRLHTSCQPHKWAETCKTLEEELGCNWETVLEIDNQNPIGSGCVAQVYKGYLCVGDDEVGSAGLEDGKVGVARSRMSDTRTMSELSASHFDHEKLKNGGELEEERTKRGRGEEVRTKQGGRGKKEEEEMQRGGKDDDLRLKKREDLEGEWESKKGRERKGRRRGVPVAVKVMHPGTVVAMERDMLLMRWVASFSDWLNPDFHWVALKECFSEFATVMRKQLDMELEALNLKRFQQILGKSESVKFPTPLFPYVTKRVLVETFESGSHISDYMNNPGGELQRNLARIGIEVLLDMLFIHNFVHGDLHPGNILVQETREPCLVLLDCGIATSLTPFDLSQMQRLFIAIIKGEGLCVADLMLGSQHCPTVEQYRNNMAELVMRGRGQLRVGKIQVSQLLSELFDVLVKHKVRMKPNYTSVFVAVMVIEGLGRSLDPNLDLLEAATPCLLHRAQKDVTAKLRGSLGLENSL